MDIFVTVLMCAMAFQFSGACDDHPANDLRGTAVDYFYLVNRNGDRKCLDVYGDPGTVNGANVRINECDTASVDGTSDNQWRYDSLYRLVNVASDKCLDVEGIQNTANGVNVDLWPCEVNMLHSDHRWTFTRGDEFYVQLKNSNTGKCLDPVGRGRVYSGQNVQQYTCEPFSDPLSNQWWRKMTSIGTPVPYL